MNIQFMTEKKNGFPTDEYDYKGNPIYRFTPNYDEMIANATCEEEIRAICEAEAIMDRIGNGFVYEIVYTAIAPSVDPHTCKRSMKWQVLQHPWYKNDDGTRRSKEEMLKDIEEEVEILKEF